MTRQPATTPTGHVASCPSGQLQTPDQSQTQLANRPTGQQQHGQLETTAQSQEPQLANRPPSYGGHNRPAGCPPSALTVAEHHGPLRKLAQLTYQGTCPACHTPDALTVQITPTGELPRCNHCPAGLVAKAIREHGNPS